MELDAAVATSGNATARKLLKAREEYHTVDKMGQIIGFLLTEARDEQAAKRFLTKAIRRHGSPL
jgi:transposase-like protein